MAIKTTLADYYDQAATTTEVQLRMVGVKTRDDKGAVSTEMAVVIGFMVAIAAAAGAIIWARAVSNAEAIPASVSPSP